MRDFLPFIKDLFHVGYAWHHGLSPFGFPSKESDVSSVPNLGNLKPKLITTLCLELYMRNVLQTPVAVPTSQYSYLFRICTLRASYLLCKRSENGNVGDDL